MFGKFRRGAPRRPIGKTSLGYISDIVNELVALKTVAKREGDTKMIRASDKCFSILMNEYNRRIREINEDAREAQKRRGM